MDFRQIAMIQKLKSDLNLFRANHPKFPMFLKAVSQDAIEEGSIIEINVTTPEGKKVLYQCQAESRRHCTV